MQCILHDHTSGKLLTGNFLTTASLASSLISVETVKATRVTANHIPIGSAREVVRIYELEFPALSAGKISKNADQRGRRFYFWI
jgi:hypothetical protein